MAAAGDDRIAGPTQTADQLLLSARNLVPTAVKLASSAKGFAGKWKLILAKLDRIPSCLSDLSTHPFFSKNLLCREQLISVSGTLSEVIELAGKCHNEDAVKVAGKLQLQSDLDSVSGKLDLNLRDCRLLVKSGVLGETVEVAGETNIGELLARLQIGHTEAKHRAVEAVMEALKVDEKSVISAIGRSNMAALVQLMAATPVRIREKAARIVCVLAESGKCDGMLVSEGAVPALVRLAESGNSVCQEKAVSALHRLSVAADTACVIVGCGGGRVLIEICLTGDSITQAAASGTLRNLSLVPELRQTLTEEGVVKVMLDLLENGAVFGSKEYAAECLQNLTSSNDSLRRSVIAEGGIPTLLSYIDGHFPQEPAVGVLRNLLGFVPPFELVELGLLPRLIHVFKRGSPGAQQMAASAICKVSSSPEMKRVIGESGCIPFLIAMLNARTNGEREVAAQALAGLMCHHQNAREVKKNEKSVPNLVQLLDHSPENTAKKYAVACLLWLSSSKRCKKAMISYGAIGYLKKLSEVDVVGSKKLLERLQRGKLRSLFSRK